MFNPNRVNIHDLTIEEPEKPSELSFDPERDITEEDWQGMRDLLEYDRKKNYWDDFISQAMNMKILNPNIDLNLDQAACRGMRDTLGKRRHSGGIFKATEIKIFDPNQNLNLDQTDWQVMKDQLKRFRQVDWGYFSSRAVEIKILDPTLDLNLDQAAWQGMRSELESVRAKLWDAFSRHAMEMKILDPSQSLNLDQAAWQGMRDKLDEYRKTNDWYSFSWQSRAMKILAAEEVKVTDKGLEIKMRKDKPLASTTPPLPETKRF